MVDGHPLSPDANSPCTKVCVLERATGWCLGCGRTGSEIAGWIGMTTSERIALKAQLAARLSLLAAKRIYADPPGR